MAYALIIKPGKSMKSRIIRTEKLRFSWKRNEKYGFMLYDLYADFSSARLAQYNLKNSSTPLRKENLASIKGCWNHIGEPKASPISTNWEVAKTHKHFVYSLTINSKIIYIGVTNNPSRRMVQHWKSGKIFDSLNVLYGFLDRKEADAFEIYAISRIRPPLNRLYSSDDSGFLFLPRDLEKFG